MDFEWAVVMGGTKTPTALSLALERKQWRVAHAATLVAQGQEAGARKDYAGQMSIIRRLLDINPRDDYFDAWLTEATVNAAVHTQGPGRDLALREAVAVARASAKRLGESYMPQMTLGVALGNAGLGEEAVKAYGRAFDRAEDPDMKARALVARAGIYMALNQPLIAMDDLKAAKKLDPENIKVQQFEAAFRRMSGAGLEEKAGTRRVPPAGRGRVRPTSAAPRRSRQEPGRSPRTGNQASEGGRGRGARHRPSGQGDPVAAPGAPDGVRAVPEVGGGGAMARSKGWSNAARRTARRFSSVLRAMAKAPVRRKGGAPPPKPNEGGR